jgi:hypothetical protein
MSGPALTHSIFALSRAVDAAETAIGSTAARDDAAELCACAARHLALPRRHQIAVRLAVRSAQGEASKLAGVAALDPSGFVQDLLARIDEARAASAPRIGAIDGAPAHVDPERARARDLILAGWRLAADLESGVSVDRALFHLGSASATLAHALGRAQGELSERAPDDVRIAARGATE